MFLIIFLKTFLFKPLFGDKKIPLLGYGTRPQKMNCGLFINNKESNSYGFPSGHSQIAWLFTTYKILNLKGKNANTHIIVFNSLSNFSFILSCQMGEMSYSTTSCFWSRFGYNFCQLS